MSINDEMFNAFLVTASQEDTDWCDVGHPSSLWVRSPEVRTWRCVTKEADPYELLPVAVSMTPTEGDREAMLLMYGWATPIDENLEVEGERTRVRIALHMGAGKERIATQFQGKAIEEHEGSGAGMFADMIEDLRTAQKELPEDKRTNPLLISKRAVEMAGLRMLEAMFQNGGDNESIN